MSNYQEFLGRKIPVAESCGFDLPQSKLNKKLFPFQKKIVQWALKRGRAAIFADCGMGKAFMLLEWSNQILRQHDGSILVFAPLGVVFQLEREAAKFGIDVNVCRVVSDFKPGSINLTNYDRIHHFWEIREQLIGIVLDESSILKAFGGETRKELTDFADSIPYRLACTATPAPNDLIELSNHSEFLGIMSGKEIIALYFKQDGNTTHSWRLKKHAETPGSLPSFYEWLATWSKAIRKPSDIGFDDTGYVLPELLIHEHLIEVSRENLSTLFPVEAKTLNEQRQAKRDSQTDRIAKCAELVNNSTEQWIIWCELNSESEALRKAIPDAIEVKGSDSPEHKEKAIELFIQYPNGAKEKGRVLISKPTIFGFGLNLQNCHNQVFVGLTHSYEQQYQAIRRSWRFGQEQPVNIHMIAAETEGRIAENLKRKQEQADQLFEELVKHMSKFQMESTGRQEMTYKEGEQRGEGWRLLLGDCVERMDDIEDESVGLTVFSPPFPGLYVYSNSVHDVGNCEDIDTMIEHFRYLVKSDKLYRVTKPGRRVCVHLCQLTAMKSRDGYIGIKDYRGRTIQMFEEEGWIYSGEVTIDKNPQLQAVRNKERGLLFKTLATDSAMMRMALADYLIYFTKPGENEEPIRAGRSTKYNNPDGWITEQEWIEWASPVWYRNTSATGNMAELQPEYPAFSREVTQKHISGNVMNGISETDALSVVSAKEKDDERHLCPLQLCVIERAIKLWSNPGDLVLDPFNGIGSTGYKALQLNRHYVGIELKESYFKQAIRNLKSVDHVEQQDLFSLLENPLILTGEPDELEESEDLELVEEF
jgi:DNA modification methylase